MSVTGIQCNGAATGAINISVSGGTGGYTYDWSNDGPDSPDDDTEDVSGLIAVLTVTVTDASACTATAVATVNQPSAILLTTTQVDIN